MLLKRGFVKTRRERLLVTAVFSLCALSCSVLHQPNRVAGIPNEAVLAGGAEGGSWLLCEPRNDAHTLYFCRVFNDFTGSEIASGEYVLRRVEWNQERRMATYFEVTQFREGLRYNSFDGNIISLKNSMVLVPIGNTPFRVQQ